MSDDVKPKHGSRVVQAALDQQDQALSAIAEGSSITEGVVRTVVGEIASSESVAGLGEILATLRDSAKMT